MFLQKVSKIIIIIIIIIIIKRYEFLTNTQFMQKNKNGQMSEACQ